MDVARRIKQNCRVITRSSRSVVEQLKDKYLSQEQADTLTSTEDACRALATRFAVDSLRLTVVDGGGVRADDSSFARLSPRVYVSRKGGLTYVAERIDLPWIRVKMDDYDEYYFTPPPNEALEFWYQFAKEEKKLSHRPELKSRVKSDEGLSMFADRINQFHDGNKNESWVVYATPADVTDATTRPRPSDIEMYVSVTTDDDAPMVTHMGIQRSFQYAAVSGHTSHRRISITLHSFAAKVMHERKRKLYMITRPVNEMRDIIIRTLPFNSYVGDTYSKALSAVYAELGEDMRLADLETMRERAAVAATSLGPGDSPISFLETANHTTTTRILDRSRTTTVFDFDSSRPNETEHAWFTTMRGPPEHLTVDLYALAENF
jgi:hypothetical protein